MRGRSAIPLLLFGCAAAAPVAEQTREPEPVTPPPEVTAELVAARADVADAGPVGHGELPWWYDVKPGVYRLGEETVILAVGDSSKHHHIAEGFLRSKVSARLAVRKAGERIRFAGAMPEPELFDLFVTRKQRFLALYRLAVPADAALTTEAEPLVWPTLLDVVGEHRLGRHIFEGKRHLFLECDVEGPIANPDWGRSRASARY